MMYDAYMKIKIYPEGYDPRVANGPPTELEIGMDITWTPEDTKNMLLLEKKAEIIDAEEDEIAGDVGNRWYEEIP